MGAVAGPDGEWTVELRWVPRDRDETLFARSRRRWGQVIEHIGDAIVDGVANALGEGLLIGLLLIGVVLLAVFVVIPLLVVVIDLVVLVLIAFGAFLLRVCFGRPWIVKARSPDGDVYTWRIVGWDKARRRKRTIATAITAGRFPPPSAGGGFEIEPLSRA